MQPIRDIVDLRPDSVVYHSAFGFARVVSVGDGGVRLAWERDGDNLPATVSTSNLARVYALCTPGGFFHRAVVDPEPLQELLQVDPPSALELLLHDLAGPQRRQDLRDWVAGRGLMSERAFDRWWETLAPLIAEDDRFDIDADTVSLDERDEPTGAIDRLANPMLSPGRRLDLALIHREELGERAFREHALKAWVQGGKQVKDLAMAALRELSPDAILGGLLDQGPDSIDALIHAIRRGGWEAHEVSQDIRGRLLDRVVSGSAQGGPLDAEGRLAAALSRWGAPEAATRLAPLTGRPDGQTLLRATLASLPPRRAEALALDLLASLLPLNPYDIGAQWLGGELVARAQEEPSTLAARVADTYPGVAAWLEDGYDPRLADELDADGLTAEVEDAITETLPIVRRGPRTPREFMALGLALARALAHLHNAGKVVNPVRERALVHPDGHVSLEESPADAPSPRPLGEPASQPADVYACATLLLEAIVGRPWPRNIPSHRGLPYLRGVAPLLPPAALAPLDAALHPDPTRRPPDGLAWLVRWQAAAVAEDSRLDTPRSDDLRLRVGFDTHVGRMKVLHTQTNQDAMFVSSRGPLTLLVVCDGISTATAGSGDVASGIAVHVVANLWEQALGRLADAEDPEIFDFLDRALRMANQAVCEAALRYANGRLEGRVPMGTTAVLAIARGNRVCLAWLGDSRAYLVGPYGAALLTADQNQAGDRMITWAVGEDPWWDATGFALVGYVGHFNEWSRAEALPVAHLALTLLQGERLVLCSDGITDYLADTHPEVGRALAALVVGDDPDEIALALVSAANRGGGGDNATAVVAGLWRPA